MSTPRRLVRFSLALTAMAGLVSCGTPEEGQHGAHLFDASISARQPEANLVAEAKVSALEAAASLGAGDSMIVVGFNFKPGTACDPIDLFIAADANSEEVIESREDFARNLPILFDEHVTCITDEAYGHEGSGSAVFGSVANAVAESEHELSWLGLKTDGCSVGEGIDVCRQPMGAPNFPQRVIDTLPAALKPGLSGTALTVSGLGQGTNLQADEIATLRDIWILYGETTGAAISFN